jgi:hypothetical protein
VVQGFSTDNAKLIQLRIFMHEPLLPPLVVPPQPTVRSQYEWDLLSPEAKAAALFAWSDFWFRPTPAVAPTDPGTRIVIPSTDTETPSVNGWKQEPTPEEKQSLSDGIWKR